MKSSKKLLSVFLAMALLFSTFSMGVSAAYSAYKDANLSEYNSIDKPVFTTNQLSSIALDEVDRMLMVEDMVITVPVINLPLDLRSCDAALNSLQDFYNGALWDTAKGMLGDLKNLQFKSINTVDTSEDGGYAAQGCRRDTAGKTDLDVIKSLINFLYDNKQIFVDYANHDLNIGETISGILGDKVAEYLDAPVLIKGLLYEAAYQVEPTGTVTETIDEMLAALIEKLLTDLEESLSKSLGYDLTFEFNNIVSISSGSFYDNVEAILKCAYNTVGVPALNTAVKHWIQEKCGVKFTNADKIYSATNPEKSIGYDLSGGDRSKLNIFGEIINIDYVIPTYNFGTNQFFTQLNNIFGQIIKAVLADTNAPWVTGNNDLFVTNLLNLFKYYLKIHGNTNFAGFKISDYVTIPTDAEIDALTLESAVVRFGRELVERFAKYVILPDEAQSVRSILAYSVLEFVAEKIPTQDLYTQMQAGTLNPNTDDAWQKIAAVIARYYANAYTSMNLADNLSFDQTVSAAVDWVISEYGGLLDYVSSSITGSDSAWKKIDKIIFPLIPINWLPATLRVWNASTNAPVNMAVTSSSDLIMRFLIGNILDLKFEYFFDLFERNASGELNSNVTVVLINRIVSILNGLIPGAVTQSYNNFDSIITYSALSSIINGLFTGIKSIIVDKTIGSTGVTPFAKAALPLICSILDLTGEQQLDDPYIAYPEVIIDAGRTLTGTSIVIRNNSQGVNTAYRDANGTLHQDSLYKVKVNSITCSNSAIGVAVPVNTVLNGGDSGTFPVTGSLAANGAINFLISYNILDESGTSLTAEPLTTYHFTYVSNVASDDDLGDHPTVLDENPINNHTVNTVTAAFIPVSAGWGGLKDESFQINRPASNADNNPTPATVSFTSFTADMNVNGDPTTPILVSDATIFPPQATTYGGYIGDKDLFQVNVPQMPDPKDATKTVDVPFVDYVGTYHATLTVTASPTTASTGAMYNEIFPIARTLYIYNDYKLGSIVNNAVGTNRQQANYATSGTFTYTAPVYDANGDVVLDADGKTVTQELTANANGAWATYLNALNVAVDLYYKPLTVANFNASLYQAAATNLRDAAAALDACAVSAGASVLEALVEQCEPANAETLEYDDPSYNYFGEEDFVFYTYDRYYNHAKRVKSMINSQHPTEPGEDATAEELAAYQTALENIPVLKAFDVTFRAHMMSMNYSRLIARTAVKTYLSHTIETIEYELINYVESDYTATSWAALTKAQAFANTVLNANVSSLTQTKVNEARRQLIIAFKSLALRGTDPADYVQLDAYIQTALDYLALSNINDLYGAAEIAALNAALADAQACARDLLLDAQATVDALAAALNTAIVNLEASAVSAGIEPITTEDGKTPVIDSDSNMISGLWIGCDLSVEQLFAALGGATVELTPFTDGFIGTGSTVTVTPPTGDPIVFTIVVYGDLTGDGSIDVGDCSSVIQSLGGDIVYEDGSAKLAAADVDNNGGVDVGDGSKLKQILGGDATEDSIVQSRV